MNQTLQRPIYLQVLQAALEVQEYRYAREIALDWLAVYPGDLAVSLAYAQALLGEKRLSQAAAVLNALLRLDPENLEAVETLLKLELESGGDAAGPRALRYALSGRGGSLNERRNLPAWSEALLKTRSVLAASPGITVGLADTADRMRAVLLEAGEQPLVGVTHLALLARLQAPLDDRLEAARSYSQRWPDCLASGLWLAEWLIESGESDEGVAMLHQAASRDIAGQVARRLWGELHPYRSLWPELLARPLHDSPPAAVAGRLGWNMLPGGAWEPLQVLPAAGEPAEPSGELAIAAAAAGLAWALHQDDDTLENPLPAWIAEAAAQPDDLPFESLPDDSATRPNNLQKRIWSATSPAAGPPSEPARPAGATVRSTPLTKNPDPDLRSAAVELDRMARKLHLPAVAHLDGRFPVYIVFSIHRCLETVYGAKAGSILESEMSALAQAVARRPGWGGRLVLADDPTCTTPLGCPPLAAIDPWSIKLFLSDLDAALAKKGERLGALLIVGGPEIVPFHHLPNPVDDQDVDVPSDNPYACRDENYLIPEWPVGRLPGGKGNDARLLLDGLRRIRESHEMAPAPAGWWKRLLAWLGIGSSRMTSRSRAQARKNGHLKGTFGYTAAVWRQAAEQVFQPIGRRRALHVSPPSGVTIAGSNGNLASTNGEDAPVESSASGLSGKIPPMEGKLGYFNLHGLLDAPEWYGQRDPLDASGAPDYPVALRPEDIPLPANGKVKVPAVVFSEACYGLHIQDREAGQAISLRFLQAGSLAVAGSTCMAYGALQPPLVAADLVGNTFWRFLQEGLPAGEALRQAKIHLVKETTERQGYLDGEDQKTLISFILYGDPLAQVTVDGRQPKSLRYAERSRSAVRTVCDRLLPSDGSAQLPADVVASVNRVVSRYLPGMSDARLTYVQMRQVCTGDGHTCPTSQLEHEAPLPPTGRSRGRKSTSQETGGLPRLVTLSKQVRRPDGVHPRVARLTLNSQGKVVKLVVSR